MREHHSRKHTTTLEQHGAVWREGGENETDEGGIAALVNIQLSVSERERERDFL